MILRVLATLSLLIANYAPSMHIIFPVAAAAASVTTNGPGRIERRELTYEECYSICMTRPDGGEGGGEGGGEAPKRHAVDDEWQQVP